MGGNKSKPVVESARSVLARRGLREADKKGATSNLNGSITHESMRSELNNNTSAEYDSNYDKEIMDKMSKWKVVHSQNAKDMENQIIPTIENVPSAALIRLQEEKEMDALTKEERDIKNIGRLTEEQATSFFKKARETTHDSSIALEFNLAEGVAKTLLAYARWPVIEESTKGKEETENNAEEDYPIAR